MGSLPTGAVRRVQSWSGEASGFHPEDINMAKFDEAKIRHQEKGRPFDLDQCNLVTWQRGIIS